MNPDQVGKLILTLRREKGLTQKQLADQMHLSDKTISKWECGLGCPDVSLLPGLSAILGVNIEGILVGDLQPNAMDAGNIKRIRFYVCPGCSGVVTSTGNADISCCGRKLSVLVPQSADIQHQLAVEDVEQDVYITFSHEMERDHYISFVAYVTSDRALLIKLYPEQGGEVRFPKLYGGTLYFYCTKHGLWVNGL